MTDYLRTQILLEKKQREALNELAEKAGVSFSELVREMIDEQLRIRKYGEMRRAAEQLFNDYNNDGELTEFTALDSEDFLNG